MALGDAITPVVYPDYTADLNYRVGPNFVPHFQAALSPADSSLTGGERRPSTGQVYPRGTK